MRKIITFIFGLVLIACNKVEPIEIVAPLREIDTETLKQYKSQLSNRFVAMGMMYNWGKESGAFLANTPDSLDVIIVKDGYDNLTDILKNDLKFVREKKATKVLVGIDFEALYQAYETNKESTITTLKAEKQQEWTLSNERLTDTEKEALLQKLEQSAVESLSNAVKENLEKQATELVQIAQANGFDGISIEFPQNLNEAYSVENFNTFLTNVVNKKGNLLLVAENLYSTSVDAVSSINWVVYRKSGNKLLANFTEEAQKWSNFRYLPSVDFTEEDLADGFSDTPYFSQGGRASRLFDVIKWNATNKGGVAYYHIEKNYYDLQGKVPFKALRNAIGKIQIQ